KMDLDSWRAPPRCEIRGRDVSSVALPLSRTQYFICVSLWEDIPDVWNVYLRWLTQEMGVKKHSRPTGREAKLNDGLWSTLADLPWCKRSFAFVEHCLLSAICLP